MAVNGTNIPLRGRCPDDPTGVGGGAAMAAPPFEKRVPMYIQRAVLRLADKPNLARKLEPLMPDAVYRVGAAFLNAGLERRSKEWEPQP
jgi:hypothetical protein